MLPQPIVPKYRALATPKRWARPSGDEAGGGNSRGGLGRAPVGAEEEPASAADRAADRFSHSPRRSEGETGRLKLAAEVRMVHSQFEVEVNAAYGDTIIVMLSCTLPSGPAPRGRGSVSIFRTRFPESGPGSCRLGSQSPQELPMRLCGYAQPTPLRPRCF